MASSFSPARVQADLSQDSDVFSNISVADLLFYRSVELQISLIQSYRNAIFDMVVGAAEVAGRMPKSGAHEGIRAARAMTDSRKKEAQQALQAAAGSAPSETESAESNLGNVVAATSLLMNNCVETLQRLDVIGQAALVQCVEMILNAAGSGAPPA